MSIIKTARGSKSAYDLASKDPDTIYYVTEDDGYINLYYNNHVVSNVIILDDFPRTGISNRLYLIKGELYIWKEKFISLIDFYLTDPSKPENALEKYINDAVSKIDATTIKYTNVDSKNNITNVHEALDEVFQISDSIRKSFANTIGLDLNDTFTKMANELVQYKSILAEILREKGIVTASATDTFVNLIDKVKSITNMNVINNTKLNVERDTTKEIVLNHKPSLDTICISVLKYIPGDTGVEKYSCHFDNSDAVNFVDNNAVKFSDGTMKASEISTKLKCNKEKVLSKGSVYSVHINRNNDVYKISNISFNDVDSGDTLNIDIESSAKPTIVYSNSDIDLTNVYEISNMKWNVNVESPNKLYMLFSFDGGKTYKTLNKLGEVVQTETSSINTIVEDGLTPEQVNQFSNLQFEKLRQGSNKMRLAYYFKVEDISKPCNNDDLIIDVNMKGSNEIATSSDYSYKIDESKNAIVITFLDDATYTILWADKNIN